MPCVCVAADDAGLRGVLRHTLEGGGHEVLEAADGDEALRLLRSRAVDLFLCDLLMPGRDGPETIGDLRREFPGLPVVAMTGGGCGGWVALLPAARRLGAAGVLYLPFGPRDVLRAVGRALRAPAAVTPPG